MPEMDGYDTIQEIRKLPRFKALPILALTAKAMKGDRERCIEAGAWDYLSKPVDREQLITVLKAWLQRFVAGSGSYQIRVEAGEHRFVAQEARRLIVHQEDVGPFLDRRRRGFQGHFRHCVPSS